MSGGFLSPLLAMRQALSGIAPFPSKLLTTHGRPRSITPILERVPPLALSLLSHGFPGSHATKHLRLLQFEVFRPATLPLFPDPGLPGANFASRVVSMGLGQHAFAEVLVVPRWLPLPLV